MLTSEIDEFAKERVSQVTRVGKFVDVRSFDQLTAVELERWRELRQSTDGYIPPFFSPVFSEAVHQSRGDVSVAVIHDADQITGFLPFHSYRGVALPAGRFFNDAHNVIRHPNTKIDWQWLLREIDCKAFDFHAMAGLSKSELGAFGYRTIQSFHANIGDDSHAFLSKLGKAHKTVGRQGQKTRKMGREIGPVSFEFDCRDEKILHQTLAWKREQYRRTHILDLFTPEWTRDMVDHLFHRKSGACLLYTSPSPRD